MKRRSLWIAPAALVAFYGLSIVGAMRLAVDGHGWLMMRFGDWWWTVPVGLFGLLAAEGPIVFLLIVQQMDRQKALLQQRYHRTLVAAANGMTRIKELVHLCRLIVYMVNRTVGLTNSALFLFDKPHQCYRLVAVRYKHLMPHELALSETDPVVEWLRSERRLVVRDELRRSRAPGPNEHLAVSVGSWMHELEMALIVPSFSSDRLLGFLVLGGKRTGQAYTHDDLELFSALTNQGALGIENAIFFEELKTNEAYMIQSEKLASLGQLASGMAHEIHNPLTIISGEAQLHLERARGRDEAVDRVLQSIIEECHRAAEITRRVMKFARLAPSQFGPVDLRATFTESLILVGYQVRLGTIDQHLSFPNDLPQVRGHQNQLQEVFLNLILHAYRSMGEQGGRLDVVARALPGEVELRFSDTGPAIPKHKLAGLFDPFPLRPTTAKLEGSGLGLFVSQRIIRAHGGSIDVRSVEGEGTTFIIRLPEAPEASAHPPINGSQADSAPNRPTSQLA